MESKKKNNKVLKKSTKKNSQVQKPGQKPGHKSSDEIFNDDKHEDIFSDDSYTTETSVTEEPEDDIEFINDIKKFEMEHLNSKLENVYQLIGKPKLKKASKSNNKALKEEYGKLISLLDEKRIVVHFQNDYSLEEKYRFITEEIFPQYVEDVSNTNLHINFIYEDFHPVLDEDEEDF
jgi:hypothetical protein